MAESDRGIEGIEQPSEHEAHEILRKFDSIIARVIHRESFPLAIYSACDHVRWDDRPAAQNGQRFRCYQDIQPGRNKGAEWETRALHVLGQLIDECGHLLKECPAPASRGTEGETCGKWFLASRPNQKFCSAQCQSRTTTRAARPKPDAGRRRRKLDRRTSRNRVSRRARPGSN